MSGVRKERQKFKVSNTEETPIDINLSVSHQVCWNQRWETWILVSLWNEAIEDFPLMDLLLTLDYMNLLACSLDLKAAEFHFKVKFHSSTCSLYLRYYLLPLFKWKSSLVAVWLHCLGTMAEAPDLMQYEIIHHIFIKPFLILWLSSKHIFTQKTRWNPERAAVI